MEQREERAARVERQHERVRRRAPHHAEHAQHAGVPGARVQELELLLEAREVVGRGDLGAFDDDLRFNRPNLY